LTCTASRYRKAATAGGICLQVFDAVSGIPLLLIEETIAGHEKLKIPDLCFMDQAHVRSR
jgi:hypothetical protein